MPCPASRQALSAPCTADAALIRFVKKQGAAVSLRPATRLQIVSMGTNKGQMTNDAYLALVLYVCVSICPRHIIAVLLFIARK